MASVAFPASLKEIGGHAFEDCVALTEVDLSKTALQEISSDAFRETGLKKVTLPASLKKIGSQAFLGTHLEEVVFSAELQEIDDEAFRGVVEFLVKLEAYKAKWDSYESYHSKIEEKS